MKLFILISIKIEQENKTLFFNENLLTEKMSLTNHNPCGFTIDDLFIYFSLFNLNSFIE